MAVAPTGAIYKALEFDGVSSRTYGVYITGEAVYNAPERAVEMITIPGRSGSFALDNGRFENITVTYPAGIFAETEADFRDAISEFRNFLCSRKGYVRLQDEYNPNEYRMAVYKSGLEVEPAMLKAGEFEITFDCKPQRWLTSGETAVTIGEWGETETATGNIVTVENEDGILGVKSLSVDLQPIQDLNGYDKPWAGGAGVNKWDEQYESGYLGVNGTTIVYIADANRFRSKNWIPVEPNTTYYYKSGGAGALVVGDTDGNGTHCTMLFTTDTLAEGRTFTTTADMHYVKFAPRGSYGATYKHDIAINYPSSVTTYSPYSNICPISGRTECVTNVCGVNVWDEEYESGSIDGSTGANEVSSSNWRSKNYVRVEPNSTYYIASSSSGKAIRARFYDKYKNYIGYVDGNGHNVYTTSTFKAPSNAYYIRFAPANADIPNHDISINYPSTDTEYHAYDGETYTTALGRTVYGGTLEQVGGELDDSYGYADLGDWNWGYSASGSTVSPYFYANVRSLGLKRLGPFGTTVHHIVCSNYATVARNTTVFVNGTICADGDANEVQQIQIKDDRFTDATSFKQAMSGVQLCYELATPQTYQLTPTEVALLLGNNNVWSEDGEVTVEYGQLPNLLINPTLFEASPMLEVEGYGTIGFNGYEIELENAVMGDVLLADKKTSGLPTFYNDFSLASLNAGDTITVNGISVIFSIFRSGVTISSVSDSNSDFSTTYKVNGNYYYFTTTLGSFTGQKGTYVGKTNTTAISGTNSNGAFTINVNYTLKLDNYYQQPNDGFCSIEYAYVDIVGHEFPTFNSSTCGTIRGNSTMSLLGNPTYVDCDLGECYLINGGDVVSLNAYIDLGSKLPTLAPGSNTITFDNTITDLKVTPRWWRV